MSRSRENLRTHCEKQLLIINFDMVPFISHRYENTPFLEFIQYASV